jgi:hypothetical protein
MLTRTGAYLAEQRRTKHLNPNNSPPLSDTRIWRRARTGFSLERDGNSVDGFVDKVVHVLALDREFAPTLMDDDGRHVARGIHRQPHPPRRPLTGDGRRRTHHGWASKRRAE